MQYYKCIKMEGTVLKTGDEWYQSISERILSLMQERRMTSRELAEQSGLKMEAISAWLHGKFQERWITEISVIAKALSVTPEELLQGSNAADGASPIP